MRIIVISRPDFFPEEAATLNRLFENGLKCLHLRKPDCGKAELLRLLNEIDHQYRDRIALHHHHDLARELGIYRLHFPEKLRAGTSGAALEQLVREGFRLSTSVHDPAELENVHEAFSYAFLSPVFDSISKPGYAAALPPDFHLTEKMRRIEVIALGGIRESNIGSLANRNFDGAALLGAVWQDPVAFPKWIRALEAGRIDKLHFISNETAELTHLQSISLALAAGCRWIQLRVKNKPEEAVLEMAYLAKERCDAYGAKLIINDFPQVARAVQSYGLHLGLADMPLPAARRIVGDGMIIGGTANTFADVQQRIREGADYVGLGPFRFTTTKQNLSPVLGMPGYERIMQQLSERELSIPIIAIGGLRGDDIPGLLRAGIHGVAMSSALLQQETGRDEIHQIQKALC